MNIKHVQQIFPPEQETIYSNTRGIKVKKQQEINTGGGGVRMESEGEYQKYHS